jgi:hypothetical protein
LGTNPQYYNGAYKIYNGTTNSEITDDIKWELYHYNTDGSPYDNSNDMYLPKIKKDNRQGGGWYLSPLTMYISGQTIYSVVVCK